MISSSAPTVSTHCRTAGGFSLLELLVVIVIVGILFSFATLAIRGTSPDELIKEEARRFNQLIQLALEEATLKGREYGVAFTPDSYTFLVQLDDGQWHDFSQDKLLRTRELQHDIEIELVVEDTGVLLKNTRPAGEDEDTDSMDPDENNATKDRLEPQLFLLSSGEISPQFSVRFVIRGVRDAYLVNGYIDGKHEVVRSD